MDWPSSWQVDGPRRNNLLMDKFPIGAQRRNVERASRMIRRPDYGAAIEEFDAWLR
jgi:hypothetical protein